MIHIKPIALPSFNRISHRPTVQIQELVALSYGINPSYMTSPTKGGQDVSWPRQVAMYFTRELTNRSLPSIGEAFGGRDHTTILYGVRRVAKRIKTDKLARADVKALRKALSQLTAMPEWYPHQ